MITNTISDPQILWLLMTGLMMALVFGVLAFSERLVRPKRRNENKEN